MLGFRTCRGIGDRFPFPLLRMTSIADYVSVPIHHGGSSSSLSCIIGSNIPHLRIAYMRLEGIHRMLQLTRLLHLRRLLRLLLLFVFLLFHNATTNNIHR